MSKLIQTNLTPASHNERENVFVVEETFNVERQVI